MASEFTPPGQWAKMTKAQVRKYIRDMKKKQKKAKKKLKEFENSWELEKEQKEVEALEKMLENL